MRLFVILEELEKNQNSKFPFVVKKCEEDTENLNLKLKINKQDQENLRKQLNKKMEEEQKLRSTLEKHKQKFEKYEKVNRLFVILFVEKFKSRIAF